jgi:GTP cyclohydrolase I
VPPSEPELRAAVEALLRAAGLDPSAADFRETPARVARLWQAEFLAGYAMDPAAILGEPVTGEMDPDVVVVGGLRFHGMCPHHLLPYRGVAHVAYIPRGKLQERATHQVADALVAHLGAGGAGCVIEAEQMCLAIPGDKHAQSGVVTSSFVGEMRDRPDLKARLLEAANLGGRAR